jgi:hypothetical protein
MNPAALTKAESLNRFATEQGAPLSTFQLVLTNDEAMDLIAWFIEQQGPFPNEVLIYDAEIARRTKNPWPVLENFQLMGLAIVPANLVLN